MASAVKGKRMANEAAAEARARARAARGRSTRKVNPRSGPSLESFLREEGIFEDAAARAVKEVLVLQIESSMAREGITKAEMARRMATSRAALDRLLDSENASVTLATLFRAASALGAQLRIELDDRPRARGRKPRRR
jgi:antitoxin HicB